jgi:hypothetical protein
MKIIINERQLRQIIESEDKVKKNLKAYKETIDEYGIYDAAKRWKTDEATAKTMKCANCAAFDISDKMYDCMTNGIEGKEKNIDALATIEQGDLGYCNFLHFKCAGARSCAAWVTGGPIFKK